jgi:hypothetical protein
MRKLLTRTSIIAVILTSSAFLVTAAAVEMPQTVTLEGCGKKQPPVEFDHAKHTERVAECGTCHHTQADLTAASTEAVQTCVSCHKDPKDAKTPSCDQMSPSKNPYHIRCMGCHRDEVKKDKSLKAPTKCTGCHKK